jgi:hypothetical protein
MSLRMAPNIAAITNRPRITVATSEFVGARAAAPGEAYVPVLETRDEMRAEGLNIRKAMG